MREELKFLIVGCVESVVKTFRSGCVQGVDYITFEVVLFISIFGAAVVPVDDWVRREGFGFVGWSGLLLLPVAYLAVGLQGAGHFGSFSVTWCA